MKAWKFFIAWLLLSPSLILASEAIGYYSSGTLRQAEVLERDTPNIHKIFVPRGRKYSTDEMISLLKRSANSLKAKFADFKGIEVGDLSNQFGGFARGHRSHQNGLDVDLVYPHYLEVQQSPTRSWWAHDFVEHGIVSTSLNIKMTWELLKELDKDDEVARFFLDQEIIHKVCQIAKNEHEVAQFHSTLNKMHHWRGHDTHLHMRLKCPEGDSLCINQPISSTYSACGNLRFRSIDNEPQIRSVHTQELCSAP